MLARCGPSPGRCSSPINRSTPRRPRRSLRYCTRSDGHPLFSLRSSKQDGPPTTALRVSTASRVYGQTLSPGKKPIWGRCGSLPRSPSHSGSSPSVAAHRRASSSSTSSFRPLPSSVIFSSSSLPYSYELYLSLPLHPGVRSLVCSSSLHSTVVSPRRSLLTSCSSQDPSFQSHFPPSKVYRESERSPGTLGSSHFSSASSRPSSSVTSSTILSLPCQNCPPYYRRFPSQYSFRCLLPFLSTSSPPTFTLSSSSPCSIPLGSFTRSLHNSHQARKLRRQQIYRDKHLDSIPSDASRLLRDQREVAYGVHTPENGSPSMFPGVASCLHRIRIEKERFLRELAHEEDHLSQLFTDEQKEILLGKSQKKKRQNDGREEASEEDPLVENCSGGAQSKDGRTQQSGGRGGDEKTPLYGRKLQELEAHVGSALRVYRLLRPDALPFYKEDSMLSMQSKLNEATLKHSPMLHDIQSLRDQNAPIPSDLIPPNFDALQFSLPVVSPRGFLLAVTAAANSVAEDLEALCIQLQVPNLPHPTHPYRLKLLLDALFDSFKLRKDPHFARDWAHRNWPRLRTIMPPPLSSLSSEEVGEWLYGHLERVCANQRAMRSRGKEILFSQQRQPSLHGEGDEEVYYSIGDDFIYDNAVLPEEYLDERNVEFPIDRAGELFKKTADFFSLTRGTDPLVDESVVTQFQNLVYTLKDIGLSNWMRMDTKEIEEFLPEGDPPSFVASPADLDSARLLLKAAARGKANLLDFDALDPYKLLYGFDAKTIHEELAASPPNPHLTDEDIDELFDLQTAAEVVRNTSDLHTSRNVREFRSKFGKSPLEALVDSEEKFLTSSGPIEWLKGEGEQSEEYVTWRWKRPAQTVYDAQKGMFVREREGVDPTVKLHELRQTLLSVNRMMSMNKQGRVYYFRAIVAVGNGRGLFGIGIAFGPTPKEARSNAALSAIQNMDFIDLDVGRTLTTPVHGQEYSAHVKIIPRALGRGLKSNLRYLPLLYLMGLDNCRVSFYGPSASARWFTRAKALKRALEQIQSRRTIANATGQKYDLLVAPGEHWMHWPDRWFRPILKDYARMLSVIKQKRPPSYRRGFRSCIDEVVPEECRPEFTPYTWKSPLQKWAEEQKKKRLISHNIYEKEVFVHPPSSPRKAPPGREAHENLQSAF